MPLERNPSSFGPADYGAAGAAEIQNSFADFEYVTLPSPASGPVKISRGFGPNFAYSNGSVPILVAFGDSSGRRFLFIPGETLNGLKFRDIYVWAAEASQAGNIALVKWGAQDFRPSIRQLPGNPASENTTIAHYVAVGEYGASLSPEIIPFSAHRLSVEVCPSPFYQLAADGLGLYYFGIGHTAQEAEYNCTRALNEVDAFALSPAAAANHLQFSSQDRPFGYAYDMGAGPVLISQNACLLGPGPVYFSHLLGPTVFANTPYNLIVREKYNTF